MTGFLEYYLSWSEPAKRAYATGFSAQLPSSYSSAEQVVVCGMGGSGVAGDYVAALASAYGGAPVYSVKGAEPPKWAGRRTLVYAVSFSGNTRETLNCARLAYSQGAGVVAVTTGGMLAEWARRRGVPVLLVEHAPAPRAGWPQLFYTLLGSLKAQGLIQIPDSDVDESLQELSVGVNEARAKARELASWVVNTTTIPVLVAPEPYYPLAIRARSEFAENSKLFTVATMLPEAGHNELEAWASTQHPLEFIVFDPAEEPWTRLMSEALGLARPTSIHRLALHGGSMLTKLVWGTWVVGLASIEAAQSRGLDPEKLTAVKAFRSIVEKTTAWGA